jgi:GH15 family glucan-1,4-alpha-glucosidase
VPFLLEKPLDLILGPDEILAGSIDATAREFEERTRDYWTEWSRTLSIPFEWQDAVIRAAIALKLCHFEETGAIVAALTSSIPEAPDTGRNWDYRYCWLRDAYFVIHALNRLGATKTMEGFLSYIENLAASADGSLQPVYGIALESDLSERSEPALAGYRGMGPVRVGNQAFLQPQHDVYGSLVLAATHSFFDRRLLHRGGLRLFETLEAFGERAAQLWDQPDAGLWELRTRSRVHTFSAAMCWAACDRLAKIAARLGETARAARWRKEAERIRAGTLERAWCAKRDSFVASFGGDELDASLLLLQEIGFVSADDPRFAGTVAAIEQELRRGPYLLRYAVPDDFGPPRTAFNICTFWYIGALAALGRRDEARELFENMLGRRNALGLLSEDLDPVSGELWGNFPQTYSMVGLINAATRLSRGWEEAF